MNAPTNSSTRVNEIDFLRFFAAFLVMLFHYSSVSQASKMSYPLLLPIASFGFYGVHLFFMISGFVILMTAARVDAKQFIISRIIRLYPAFWVCCTITSLLLLFTSANSDIFGTYIVNMTMLSGFFKIASIDPSYWTLFVEIQFYTFILIILLLKKISNIHILLMFWLLITALLIPFNYGKIHRIFITDYSAYFAAGAGFFLIWKDGISRKNSLIVLAGYVLAIYKHMTQNGNFYPQSQHNLLIASIIITLFFVFFYFISTRLTGKLGQQQWIKLGAITYPLYLIHQIVGFKIFNAFYSTINKHILFWGTIVLMLLVSYLISQHLEKKFASVLKVFLNKVDSSIINMSLFPRKKV